MKHNLTTILTSLAFSSLISAIISIVWSKYMFEVNGCLRASVIVFVVSVVWLKFIE